jgi:hypothetical protein
VILLIVQPEDHRWVLGDVEQQVAVISHALLTEQLDLLQQLVVIVDL